MTFVAGYKQTKEHKAKIGKANSHNMRRLWRDPDYRANQIAKRKGVIPANIDCLRTETVRKKISESNKLAYVLGKRKKTNLIHGKSKTSEYRVAYENTRRVRKLNAEGSHTIQEWEKLKAKHGHKCVTCKKKKKLTRDHIQPLSKGGSDFISNIQPLCASCNSRKSAIWVD